MNLTPDQRRMSIELDDLYEGWREDAQTLSAGRLRWKERSGHDYLCLLFPGTTTGKGMGPRSPHTEALYAQGQETEAREAETWKRLLVKGRLFKASKLPTIHDFAAKALRELDIRGLLGEHVRVIGSTALVAYEIEAGVRFSKDLLATDDFDLAWVSDASATHPPQEGLLAALKASDSYWTISQEKSFQLRNRSGEMIDVVVAPALYASYPKHEPIRALPTQGQEYLLGGMPVSHVVVDSNGKPARVVAPDPRLFALHKLYLSKLPTRGVKAQKDAAQGRALLAAITQHLPHYPLDAEFVRSLPVALAEMLQAWQTTATPPSVASPVKGRRSLP